MDRLDELLRKRLAAGRGTLPSGAPALVPAAGVIEGEFREVSMPCPTCGDLGYIRSDVPVDHPAFGKAFPCPECHKTKPLASLDTFIPRCARHWRDPLDGCEGCMEIAAALTVAREFAYEDWPRWVVLLGSYGCGKTYLATLMVRARPERAYWTETQKFLSELYSAMKLPPVDRWGLPNMTEEQVMADYQNAPLLLLDEMGRESQTDASKNRLSLLLNERYNKKLRTVITSNLTADEIAGTWPNIWSRMQDKSVGLIVPLWNAVDARPYLRPLPKEGA